MRTHSFGASILCALANHFCLFIGFKELKHNSKLNGKHYAGTSGAITEAGHGKELVLQSVPRSSGQGGEKEPLLDSAQQKERAVCPRALASALAHLGKCKLSAFNASAQQA